MTLRDEIFQYVKKKYRVTPDYPLPTAMNFPVLRHRDNRKWFAIIMDVEKEKLGISGPGRTDVINVKLADPMFAEMLTQQPGYFRGYHLNRGNWISILLDGTVPVSDICVLIDESFLVTASKQNRQKLRPAREWLVPANPKYYGIEHAFEDRDEIDWKQGKGIRTGDTVYLYAAAPVSAILYKCQVTETDIPFEYRDGNLTMTALMKVKLKKRYRKDKFTYEILKEQYGISAIRGPRGIPYSLSEALKK